MDKVLLERCETGDQGTFGKWILGSRWWYSLELPMRDNQSNVSCIPLYGSGEVARYRGIWTLSPRFKRFVYILVPTGHRTGIRFHSANLAGNSDMGFRAQLNGCVAIGKKLGFIDGQKAVLISKPAVSEFEFLMGGKPFDLEVVNKF